MKLICGVAINDADYRIHEYRYETDQNGKKIRIPASVCPFYRKWHNMIKRCYDPKHAAAFPSYEVCHVTPEWHYFMTFRGWMEKQDWQGKQLDKDLLIIGNKVYSPDTCIFVSPAVNSFILEHTAKRGPYPIGVCKASRYDKYIAQCCSVIEGGSRKIGQFDTPDEAHQAWLKYKLEQAYILAGMQTDKRIADALIYRYENYTELFGNGIKANP